MPPITRNLDFEHMNRNDLNSRLLSLTQDGTYTLTQINGQRIFRKNPNFWSGPEPSRKCEIFIGRIPHDCFEDVLVPLFKQAGELFEFRLMINFSGWNRGYAFAMYISEADTVNAICMFNNYAIRPSWPLGVCQSINNCRIFISRIPPTTSAEDIVRLLYSLTEEVKEVRIRRAMAACAAIVEYKSHRGAAMARKALVSASIYAWGPGARPTVDWSLNHSPQLLKQYPEVGHMTPLGEVKLWHIPDEEDAPPVVAAPSYALEPRQQARRMRLIYEAQRPNSAGPSRYDGRLGGVPALMPPLSQPNPQWSKGYNSGWSNGLNNGSSNVASNGYNRGSINSLMANFDLLSLESGAGEAMAENGMWVPPSTPLPPIQSAMNTPIFPNSAPTALTALPPSSTFNPWTAKNPFLDYLYQKNGPSSE